MLILESKLIGTPVMSLQTGMRLAVTKKPLIDPANLTIIAYELDGPLLAEKPSFLRIVDVRELGDVGMIIDSNDEFIGKNDVVSIQKIYELNFNLIGLNVINDMKHKLGKVSDSVIDTDTFTVQQICVKKGIIKGLSEPELLIHRSQIIEVNDNAIIVKSTSKKLESIEKPNRLTYLNPFRQTAPQAENSTKTL
jgi:uncharacterized protein YrrD